jgi:hypothetical protein
MWFHNNEFRAFGLDRFAVGTANDNPSVRDACNETISSSHAATIEVDIAEAMQKYGIGADWTADGLALYTQAVLQGASFLQKPKVVLTSLLPASIACTDILRCFSASLTQGE